MVIGFSMFGYIAYIFSYALSEKGNLIDLIRRSFPWAVLPQILMLFYAIYLRIHQYDITINRYFVVIFGFWLTGISLYYALAREKRLMWITISLAFIIVLISFGPWSVFSLPLHRQYDRLTHQLEQAQILSGSTITPLISYDSITADLSSDLYMGIGYVCQFQECALVKRLFAKELEAALQKQATDWEASESKYRACRVL